MAEDDALATMLRFDPVEDLVARAPPRSRTASSSPAAAKSRTSTSAAARSKGAVIVRAAVSSWVETGTWDAEAARWSRATRRIRPSVPVFDYTLRQRGDVWKVVDRAAPEDGPFFYDTETGEFGSGP